MSDIQRGLDIANYYQDILDNPVPLVPFNRNALELLKERCKQGMSAENVFSMSGLAGPQSSKGWDTVETGDFNFPVDHGPHYGIRGEWWYLASNFWVTGLDKPISILFVIARNGVLPPYMLKNQDPKDVQVVTGILNVTLPDKQKHYKEQVFVDGKFVTMSHSPFYVNAGSPDISFRSDTNGSIFPMTVTIKINTSEIVLNLKTSTIPDYFAQGINGCAPCVSGLGFRYYSWPNISATANILIDGNQYTSSNGSAWMDHQWESHMMPLGYLDNYYLRAVENVAQYIQNKPRISNPWNWFFFQLNDNTQITTALLPAPDIETGKGPYKLTITSILDSNNNTLKRKDVDATVTYHDWIKGPSGTIYPIGWTINLPSENMILFLTPTLQDQFTGANGGEFYEGGITITGTKNGKDVTGVGFAEMFAYLSSTKTIDAFLKSLNFSSNNIQTHRNDFMPVRPNIWIFIISILIVLSPLFILTFIIYSILSIM
jgi:predicted secreted hydrolase